MELMKTTHRCRFNSEIKMNPLLSEVDGVDLAVFLGELGKCQMCDNSWQPGKASDDWNAGKARWRFPFLVMPLRPNEPCS